MATTTIQQVPYVNLGLQFEQIRDDVMARVERALASGMYIMGDEVTEFEEAFAKLSGTRFAVGMNSGTDALILPMNGLGIGEGDEVIVPPNSYLASASSVALAGATPVFVDVADDYNIDPDKLEAAISPRTKAIMVVHLTGRPAKMHRIMEIAEKHGLHVFEDCAQAVGASLDGQPVGSFGIIGAFSLHPLKNLNAAGDAGVVTTNDEKLYQYLLKARTHGHKNRDECEFWSLNSRLDTLQAAVLLGKLPHLDRWTARRREIASTYQERLSKYVWVPTDAEGEKAVYHTFIIRTDQQQALREHLAAHKIGHKVHYPIPIHLQKAAEYLGHKEGDFPVTEGHTRTMISLPVYPELTDEQLDYICTTIQQFFE